MVYVYHSSGLLVVLGRIKLSKPPAENISKLFNYSLNYTDN